MALNGATFTKSASAFTPTGGSAATIVQLLSAPNGGTFSLSGQTLDARDELVATVKLPKPASGSPGGYTQARVELLLKRPLLLANGETTFNTVRMAIGFDRETDPSTKLPYLSLDAAALLSDSTMASFWRQLLVG